MDFLKLFHDVNVIFHNCYFTSVPPLEFVGSHFSCFYIFLFLEPPIPQL